MKEDLLKQRIPCGELESKDITNEPVVVSGWVYRYRDQGGVIFLDLRDRSGLLQIVFDRAADEPLWKQADRLRAEDVILVRGLLRARAQETINPKMKTGEVELVAHELVLYNKAVHMPISTDEYDSDISEENRLRHRFIDMRRADVQTTLRKRHEMLANLRNFLNSHGFWEVETPVLNRSTPEGARDFLVPSRLNPGDFYALPQSPQIFKQVLMVGQVERYYQIARCFRDEDLRKDRQPEFTQLDIEMSFVNPKQIRLLMEEMIADSLKKTFGINISGRFAELSYKESMEKYGTDAPDLRFEMTLVDLDAWAKTTEFKVFQNAQSSGGRVMGLRVPGGASLSRKDLDELTAWVAQDFKAKGLAWIKHTHEGLESVVTKFIPENAQGELIKKTGSQQGDIILFGADHPDVVFPTLSALRLKLAERFGLIPENEWRAAWITGFPLFQPKLEAGSFDSMHNPFSSPDEESLQKLEALMSQETEEIFKEKAGEVFQMGSLTYDLVLNGVEVGGGGVRNHRADVQEFIFRLLGLSQEEIKDKFGFLLNALNSGAPPHGGIALGLDRILMLLLRKESIRDVIPFPKTQKGQCLMSEAPSSVEEKQLKELQLKSFLQGSHR